MLTGCTIEKQNVSYSNYALGYLINRIVGNEFNVTSIQENVITPYAKLKEDYTTILDNSLIFFHLGDLEPYMETHSNVFDKYKNYTYDIATLNSTYPFLRYTRILIDNKETFVEGPYYKGEVFDTIDTHAIDLSLWNDPIAMVSIAKDINDYFTSNYAEKAKIFNDNFSKLELELYTLESNFQALASSMRENNEEIKFVSISSSYGIFQKNYGVSIYPIVLSKYGSLPSKEQLNLMIEKIIKDNVKYIVYESNMTDEMIELFNYLETRLGLTRVYMNNLSSLTDSQLEKNQDYITLMYENLASLTNMISSVDDKEDLNIEEITKNINE